MISISTDNISNTGVEKTQDLYCYIYFYTTLSEYYDLIGN